MATQQDLPLPAPASSGTVAINVRCMVRAEDEQRVVVVAGFPMHHYSVKDAVAEAYAVVLLVDNGYATQTEVAVAFGCSERTVRRHQQRYADGGMTALATRSGWRPGRRRIPSRRVRIVERLKAEGESNREIARRLGVTERAIRKLVGPSERPPVQQLLSLDNSAERGSGLPAPSPAEAMSSTEQRGLTPPRPEGQTAPSGSPEQVVCEEPEPVARSLDPDPADRTWDRLLACFGLLDDAAPVFGNAQAVPGSAVLCALPVLVQSGIFRIAHNIYGEIGPAFYGLRTTLVTLLLMALWRTPE